MARTRRMGHSFWRKSRALPCSSSCSSLKLISIDASAVRPGSTRGHRPSQTPHTMFTIDASSPKAAGCAWRRKQCQAQRLSWQSQAAFGDDVALNLRSASGDRAGDRGQIHILDLALEWCPLATGFQLPVEAEKIHANLRHALGELARKGLQGWGFGTGHLLVVDRRSDAVG